MRRNVAPAIVILCFAITTSSQAAYMREPPAGDGPAPDGWLFVEIPPIIALLPASAKGAAA